MPARRGEENLPVRWAALLGTLGEADTRRVLKRLRCSNACIEETAVLVRETAGGGRVRELSPRTRIGPFHRPPYCLRQQGPTPADGPRRNSRTRPGTRQ